MNLKMIAKEANVSVMTVSNVINGKHSKVSDSTRERIEAIIDKYNYAPNRNARTLVGAKSKMIGIIIPCLDVTVETFVYNPYYSNLIGMIEPKLGEHDYFLLVKSVRTMREAVNVINAWNVDAVIFVGLFEEDVLSVKKEIKKPFICIDTFANVNQVTCITADDELGGYEATKYLIENGHQDILFLSPKINKDGVVKERFEGYKRALNEFELLSKLNHLEVEGCTIEVGQQLAPEIINRNVSAVLTTADILAIGLMSELKNRGISVPEDISIIGYDNLDIGKLMTPQLTSIDQNVKGKIDYTIEVLLKMLENPADVFENIRVMPHLVARESVKNIN